MPALGRVYVDTNILVRMYEGALAERRVLTSLVVRADNSDQTRFVTSELTRAEVLVHPIRNQDDDLIALYDSLLIDGGMLKIAPVDQRTTNVAATLRARSRALKLPDAIHIATALVWECKRFLTAGRGIKGAISLPPDPLRNALGQGYPADRAFQIIRPDAETLASLLAEFAA